MRRLLACFGIFLVEAAQAGGFSLYTEGSAVEVGNFAAGSAAEAPDASTSWFNPAGMVRLKKKQVLFSGVGVFPHSALSGQSTFSTVDYPDYVQSFRNLSGADPAVVPALHYVHPLGDKIAAGLSVLSPFGLSTDWGTTSPLRYAGTLSGITTVDVSPALAGAITEQWSLGLGLDLQWSWVNFNSVLGSPAELQFLQQIGGLVTPQTLDSTSTNHGSSFGIGFHAGIMGRFSEDHTRVGLNYQSAIQHRYQGYSSLEGRLADPSLENPDAVFSDHVLHSNPITLPDIWTLSLYQDINAKLALLGSVVYTGWSSFQQTSLYNVAAFSPEEQSQMLMDSTNQQSYRNTWRFALGANYALTPQWKLRCGGGYDQTPTVDAERDIRMPDGDRAALAIGAHYQMSPELGFDVGYAYLWTLGQPIINKTQALGETSQVRVNARASNTVQLVGAQVTWNPEF
jgi:long-chain fatty acid transport protein